MTARPSAPPANPGYLAARQQWIAEGLVLGGAAQNGPLGIAVADLRHGEVTDTNNTAAYPAAISAIEDFEKLPITSLTRAERAEGNADLAKINRFFHVRAFAGCGQAFGPDPRAAATAWSTEPSGTSSGIAIGPLQQAVMDLAGQMRAHPAETSCYPGAMADLHNLETATIADIASGGAESTGRGYNLYGAEIAYLNSFFAELDPNDFSNGVLTYGNS